jgi:phage terminase small subunit
MGLRGALPKTSSLLVDEVEDGPLLRAYDAWVLVLDKAIAEVEAAERLVSRTPNGLTQKIPELNVLADATKQILSVAAQLGRSPAARVRLGADSEREEDFEEPDLPALPKRKRATAKV